MNIFTVLEMFMGSIRYFMKLFIGVERTVCQTGTESVKDAGKLWPTRDCNRQGKCLQSLGDNQK